MNTHTDTLERTYTWRDALSIIECVSLCMRALTLSLIHWHAVVSIVVIVETFDLIHIVHIKKNSVLSFTYEFVRVSMLCEVCCICVWYDTNWIAQTKYILFQRHRFKRLDVNKEKNSSIFYIFFIWIYTLAATHENQMRNEIKEKEEERKQFVPCSL